MRMRQITFTVPFLILMLMMIMPPVHAVSDVPYSWVPFAPNKCRESELGSVNANGNNQFGFGVVDPATGTYDSDFNGLTLTKISLYLCAGSDSGSAISDSTLATIGVF